MGKRNRLQIDFKKIFFDRALDQFYPGKQTCFGDFFPKDINIDVTVFSYRVSRVSVSLDMSLKSIYPVDEVLGKFSLEQIGQSDERTALINTDFKNISGHIFKSFPAFSN